MNGIKTKLLKSIGAVFDESKGSGLPEDIMDELVVELSPIANYLGVRHEQAFFVAMIIALNYKGMLVDLYTLIDHFECNPMRVLEFLDELDELVSKGILEKSLSRNRFSDPENNDYYRVNKKITDAILHNRPMPNLESPEYEKVYEVLEELYKLWERRDDGELLTFIMFNNVRKIVKANRRFPVIEEGFRIGLSLQDALIYLLSCWKTVMGSDVINLGRMVSGMCDKPSERIEILQQMTDGTHKLIKKGLIKINESDLLNEVEGSLTEYSKGVLRKSGVNLKNTKRKNLNAIRPEDIKTKTMFYNEPEGRQVERLGAALEEERLCSVQERLAKRSLPLGIAVMLYGPPGTGKTETVYQLARKTGREIIAVDISKSKSMWFGQSEKIIKKIFTDYREYAGQCDLAPILLFNEADAILSRRKEITLSGTAQTENAIQNIILEELERFEGVFFATTNMVINLDPAFERRFLFKVFLDRPGPEIKARIWRSKLKRISETDGMHLANRFDFSGAQIDNVIRKCEMEEVITGKAVTLEELMEFCQAEKISERRNVRIGYIKN